jgi:hypothetical protein
MLTAFVFGSMVTGGVLVLGMPLVFGSLLSLRYPQPRALAQERFPRKRSDPHAERTSRIRTPASGRGGRRAGSLRRRVVTSQRVWDRQSMAR